MIPLAQCAMCGEVTRAAREGAGALGLADGLFVSFALMMSLPILVVGAVAFLIWRARRRAARRPFEAAGDG